MHPLNRRRTPSFIVAVVALFVVLAGTAAAAAEFVVDSPADMAPNVVTTPAIANQSVTAAKLAPGATPNILSAKVDENGTFLKGFRALGSKRIDEGRYEVRFNRDVSNCVVTGTARQQLAVVHIDNAPLQPDKLLVRTNVHQELYQRHAVLGLGQQLRPLGRLLIAPLFPSPRARGLGTVM